MRSTLLGGRLPPGKLPRRATDHATTGRRRFDPARLWLPLALIAALGLVSGFGLVLARAQGDARVALQDRFQTRLDLTANFATAYDSDVLDRQAAVAVRHLAGSAPTEEEFDDVMKDFGFAAGTLLDSDGRAMQVYPDEPALLNTDMTTAHPNLARALKGIPSISNVEDTDIGDIPVIAYSTAFDTPFGRRVLSGAFDVSTTPLSDHIQNALPYAGGEVYLVDAAGALVASNVPLARFLRSFDSADHGLAVASAISTSGRYERDDEWRWFTTSPVNGSSLVMVASAPENVMYLPVEGTAEWLPWVVILALGIGSVYTVRVLFALHRSREDYVLLARVDPLTGVSNRRALSDQAERVLSEARASREPVAVLMIDLDRFKSINDTLGHEAGDEVLRVVTARIRNALRGDDLLGRWGGEEFVAVLPGASMAQALVIADRVRMSVSDSPIAVRSAEPRTVTASVGCAITTDEDIDHVLRRADGAMYRAKLAGDSVVAAPALA
jgi:diguanylate cyclase (GGDEF)-like protein